MDDAHLDEHLSRIATRWSVVWQAHQQSAPDVASARQALVQRYLPALYRYVLAAVRDPDMADEVLQEFALRVMRGDFKGANPERGRFRDYVKTSLRHLIIAQHQRAHGRAQPLADPGEVADSEPGTFLSDREFLDRWREELLKRAWEALKEVEQETGRLLYTVLHFRSENAGLSSSQMAEQLSTKLGKPLTDTSVRQTLHRAREKFADLLVAEVGRSLETDDRERIEQELIDLELLVYCRSALQRRDQEPPGKAKK
ncbi:MAG TPA: sigma-70 family RNA polymerase sigma factor [Gemmataceae bacterium]|nr:sigma-70 family RNA polymerase sigma factor [Gemmataceae bacterium]